MPAKAGTQKRFADGQLDSGLRRNDVYLQDGA